MALSFDVVRVVGQDTIKSVVAKNLSIREAIDIQTRENSPLGAEIAVVLPSGSYEAPGVDSDASEAADDSEAIKAAENASGRKSRVVVMTGDGKTHLMRPMSREEAEQLAEVCRGAQQVDIVEDDSDPELFDVLAIDGLGMLAPECLNKSVPLERAVASALGWNEAASTNTVAVVVPAETVPTSQPAKDPQQERGYNLDGTAYSARTLAFQHAFRTHWEQVGKSIEFIDDACSLGIVAKSLKDLCVSMGAYEDDFTNGFHGGVDDQQLIAALGWDE